MKKRIGCTTRLIALAGLGCLPIAKGHADDICPTYVVLPSGTVFDVAKMIEDSGSPAQALEKARKDLLQISRNGGCASVRNTPRYAECQEIVAAAKKALSALESCANSESVDAAISKRRR